MVDERVRKRLEDIYAAIDSGAFSREFESQVEAGLPRVVEFIDKLSSTDLEKVGKRVRERMSGVRTAAEGAPGASPETEEERD